MLFEFLQLLSQLKRFLNCRGIHPGFGVGGVIDVAQDSVQVIKRWISGVRGVAGFLDCLECKFPFGFPFQIQLKLPVGRLTPLAQDSQHLLCFGIVFFIIRQKVRGLLPCCGVLHEREQGFSTLDTGVRIQFQGLAEDFQNHILLKTRVGFPGARHLDFIWIGLSVRPELIADCLGKGIIVQSIHVRIQRNRIGILVLRGLICCFAENPLFDPELNSGS